MREDSVAAPTVTAEHQGLSEQEGAWPLYRFRRIGALALAYGIAGAVGLMLAVPPGYATSVWPSSGIALAGLLLWGTRVWPGIWLGSFFVNVWVAYAAQGSAGPLDYAIAANIAVGSTVQALLVALLIRKWVGVSKLFEVASATVAFAALTAICCLIASTWGVATLKLAGLVEFGTIGESWRTWWLGDFIGILIITPALMTWRQLLPIDSPPGYVVETIGSLVLHTGVTAFVF
jgi:integral membrane sensor domain MASE1